eukprot:scaffold3767_cov114-Isochrysis_galbana.AAC.5
MAPASRPSKPVVSCLHHPLRLARTPLRFIICDSVRPRPYPGQLHQHLHGGTLRKTGKGRRVEWSSMCNVEGVAHPVLVSRKLYAVLSTEATMSSANFFATASLPAMGRQD